MTDNTYIIKKVTTAVRSIDPDAEIILYGSRASGTCTDESDWDFLIVSDLAADDEKKQMISRALYKIEWETCEVISPIIHDREYWQSPRTIITPFYKNVVSQGIIL